MPTIAVNKIYPHVEAGAVKVTRYFMSWAGGQVKEEKTLSEGGSYSWETQWDEDPWYKLEFVPSGEYNFIGWRWVNPDGSTGPLQEDRVSFRQASYVINAYFQSKAIYTLTLDKRGEGSVTQPGSGQPFPRTIFFHKWDVAAIRCYPETGWYFDYFDVDGHKETGFIDYVGGLPMNALDLVMTENHTVICVFGKWLKIEGILGSGSGYVDITMGDGTTSRWSIYNRKAGETVTLTATGMGDYVFDYYLINGVKVTQNPYTFTLQDDVRYEAYFKSGAPPPPPPEKVTLTIVSTEGGTTSPAPGTYQYDKGSQAIVTAFPDAGYRFVRWKITWSGGEITHPDNPLSLVMDRDYTVTPSFEPTAPPPPPPPEKVSLIIVSTEGGTTSPAPGTYQYDKGSQVAVTAIPNTGYVFDHWDVNGARNTSNPITLVLNNDTVLTAYFKKTTPPPPSKGRLEVHAYANGREVAAQVTVDTLQFTTPFTLDVDPGTYTLKATFYEQEQTKTATVIEGQTTRVDFRFAAPPPEKAVFPWWLIGSLLFGAGMIAAGRRK